MSTFAINDKRVINAWAIFDWANSAYSLVISTAIFPIYFIAYTPENIQLGSLNFSNSALYSFAVTFSYLIIACFISGPVGYRGLQREAQVFSAHIYVGRIYGLYGIVSV
jgi:MFS transporter, UMF1 family